MYGAIAAVITAQKDFCGRNARFVKNIKL